MKTIRQSKAKTAWGLCADVIKAIQQEPKRIHMGTAIERITDEDNHLSKHVYPQCGTVGCFAGWVQLLFGRRPDVIEHDWTSGAMRIFGPKHIVNYYMVGGCYVFNAGLGDCCSDCGEGTPAMAKAVTKRIKRFMHVNEKALRARKLSDARAEIGDE